MYRNRNNGNLMEELEGREMALATMNMPQNYKNMYRTQISAIKKELVRRWRNQAVARDAPRHRARAAKVIQKKFKNIYYAPTTSPRPWIHGRGYRRAMARARGRTASPSRSPKTRAMNSLKAKFENLKTQRNRGAMVNLYNSMSRNWRASGRGLNGANIMNRAQKIMHRAGLI